MKYFFYFFFIAALTAVNLTTAEEDASQLTPKDLQEMDTRAGGGRGRLHHSHYSSGAPGLSLDPTISINVDQAPEEKQLQDNAKEEDRGGIAAAAGRVITTGASTLIKAGGPEVIVQGVVLAAKKISEGASYVGNKIREGASYVGNKIAEGASWVGNQLKKLFG